MRAIKVENIRTADCGQWERKEFAGCLWFSLGHSGYATLPENSRRVKRHER